MWVASTDYFEDVKIGKEVLAGASRRVSQAAQHVPLPARRARRVRARASGSAPADMPELERYVLAPAGRARRRAEAAVEAVSSSTAMCGALTDFAQRRSVGVLLRYPQGLPVLRCARPALRQAARVPDRARHAVPRAGALAIARCWCSPARRLGGRGSRGRVGASVLSGRRLMRGGETSRSGPNGHDCASLGGL